MKQFKTFFILITISSNLFANVVIFKSTVDTVKQYSRLTINITSTIPFVDPYNSQDISMDAIFKTGTDSLIVPCFYLSGNMDTSKWQARFAPMKTGQCNYYLRIKTADTSFITAFDTLTVVDSSKNGFISVDSSSFFQFKFSNGKPFRGIGLNLDWELPNLKYEILFKAFNERQANFTRLFMCPWNLGIQWNNNQYAYNLNAAARMDSVVDLAEKYGIYFILTLDYHGALTTQPDVWGGNNFWLQHPANVINGGTCVTPKEFFYNKEAKERYKDRLRYLVGRWGYSQSICLWEFWNEIDNAISSENIPADSVYTWHVEMARYLKALDPYHHLISTSFVNFPGFQYFFAMPELSISQIHQYWNLETMSSNIEGLRAQYSKPAIIAEFAYDWHIPTNSNINDYLQSWHDGLWGGLFSTTPILPMSWWWDNYYFNSVNNYDNLRHVAEFSEKISESGPIKKIFVPTGNSSLEQKGLIAGNDIFLWIRNSQTNTLSNITLTISNVTNGPKKILFFNPVSGDSVISGKTVTNGILTIDIDSIQSARDIAIKVSDMHDTIINTSINSTEIKNEFQIFPNPVLNTLTILGNYIPAITNTVTITNGYGDILKNLIWDNSSGSLAIDMGQFPTGLCIVKISNTQKTNIFKVIHVK